MDENLHDIEDIFHSALNDNEEAPSPEVWNEVDKRIDKETVISIKKKYAIVKGIAILLLFLLGISIYLGIRISNNNPVENNNLNLVNDKMSILNKNKNLNRTNGDTSGISTKSGKEKLVYKKIIKQTDLVNAEQIISNEPDEITYKKDISNKNYIYKNSQSKIKYQSIAEILDSAQTARITSKPLIQSKTENETPDKDSRYFTANKSEMEQRQLLSLKSPLHPFENRILHANDSIDIKNTLPPLLSSMSNVLNTHNRSIEKNKRKNSETLSRFSITPFFSPDIAWYHLQDENTNNQSVNAVDMESEEKHEFSSTYGVMAEYMINKHWRLQSGITISNTNIVTEPEMIYAQSDNTGNIKYRINISSGYGYVLPSFSTSPVAGDSLYAFTSTHSLQYLGIPMSATYSILKNKFLFGLRVGIAANYLMKAKLETPLEEGFNNSVETVDHLQGLKKIYFNGLTGIDIDLKVTNKISVAFAPTFRFALGSINNKAPVKSYPKTFGSVVGLKIGL